MELRSSVSGFSQQRRFLFPKMLSFCFYHHVVGVLKFMAKDKVDRNTAQAEMDAYLQNPNDWACT